MSKDKELEARKKKIWKISDEAKAILQDRFKKGELIIDLMGHEGRMSNEMDFMKELDATTPFILYHHIILDVLKNNTGEFVEMDGMNQDCRLCGIRSNWETDGKVIRWWNHKETGKTIKYGKDLDYEYPELIKSTDRCIYEHGIDLKENIIDIPSGKLVFHNKLHDGSFIDKDIIFDGKRYQPENSINHHLGRDNTAKAYAEKGIAWGMAYHTVAISINKSTNQYYISDADLDDNDDYIYPEGTEYIDEQKDTDVWCWCAADYEHLKALNPEALEKKMKGATIIDVPPGKYKFVNMEHIHNNDPEIWAMFERVGDIDD